MRRRDFLMKGLLFSVGFNFIIHNALAAVEWLKVGTLGYKEVAPENRMKLGQKCSTCQWYKADEAVEGGGKCTLTAIAKGKDVWVKDEGHCNMWKKQA
jgi:hypothetical protein